MAKVAKEVAKEEVNKWLDGRKIRENVRTKNQDSIETLVALVEAGDLVVNDDLSVEYTLLYPLGKSEQIKTLKIKSRLNLEDTRGVVKFTDKIEQTKAMFAAMTDEPLNVFDTLSSQDIGALSAIQAFF